MLLLIVFLVTISSSVDVWVANFIFPNTECLGDSPFILRYDNDTCTPSKCGVGKFGFAYHLCETPVNLGNYAKVRKYQDTVPGDCAEYWSDGYPILDSCQNFTIMGPQFGYIMGHCDGKNFVQHSYTNEYCSGEPQGVVSHYIQDTCVVDGFGDNDMFVKFGRCGV